MKIAFLSDTHHDKRAVKAAIDCINNHKADAVIHLGDCTEDIELIKENFQGNVYGVSGNCDFTRTYAKEEELHINGRTIYFTHGDLYGVKRSLSSIALKAESIGADIVLFGHTHIKLREEFRNVLFMNPGSISRPSPWSRVGAVGFITIDEAGIIDTEFYDIKL